MSNSSQITLGMYIANRLDLDYNYLLALNGVIDDEPEIRAIQRAATLRYYR